MKYLFTVFLALFFLASLSQAQPFPDDPGPYQIRPRPDSLLHLAGETFDVLVRINTGTDSLFFVSFELNFDQRYLVLDTTNIVAGIHMGTSPLIQTFPSSNSVVIAVSRIQSEGGIPGLGTVAIIPFYINPVTNPGLRFVSFSLTGINARDPQDQLISLGPLTSNMDIAELIVWPGDTDNDGDSDAADILPIGFYYEVRGPSRSSFGNITWEAQGAEAWSDTAATYSDGDGDGETNELDIRVIGFNFGNTWTPIALPKISLLPGLAQTAAVTLGASVTGSTAPGEEFVLNIEGRAEELFGIAFITAYKPTSHTQPLQVEPGPLLKDILFISHIDSNRGLVHAGLTQTRGTPPVSDIGTLLKITMRVSEQAKIGESIDISFAELIAQDANGNKLIVFANDFSILIDSVLNQPDALPLNFALYQNYPNPFNPSTNIEFDIGSLSEVNLSIYNALGQKIKTLVQGTLTPKNYTMQWDGTDDNGATVANGIYFYQLIAKEFSSTKKMILMR